MNKSAVHPIPLTLNMGSQEGDKEATVQPGGVRILKRSKSQAMILSIRKQYFVNQRKYT